MTFYFTVRAGAFLVAAALNGAALAAPVSPHLPPPGLYRVDIDANSAYRDGTTVATQQPANGAVTMRAQKPGSTSTTRTFPNNSPQQICVGERAAAGSFNPMALQHQANCTNASAVTGATGTTFTARCDSVDITSVVRKLSATTWEIKSQADMHLGSKGMLDFDAQRKLVEISLKNATTAEERADAQYTLDHWEEFKADMRQSAAEAGAAGAPGAVTQRTATVTRMTRVAESCKAASAAGGPGR